MTTAKITGTAYGRPASIEVTGDTVMWRAKPDAAAENIVTTVHEIRAASWRSRRISWPGVGFVALGAVWIVGEGFIVGAIAFAVAIALLVRRYTRPTRTLRIEVGSNQLLLEVAPESAAAARGFVQRVDRAITTGETPSSPPTLP